MLRLTLPRTPSRGNPRPVVPVPIAPPRQPVRPPPAPGASLLGALYWPDGTRNHQFPIRVLPGLRSRSVSFSALCGSVPRSGCACPQATGAPRRAFRRVPAATLQVRPWYALAGMRARKNHRTPWSRSFRKVSRRAPLPVPPRRIPAAPRSFP